MTPSPFERAIGTVTRLGRRHKNQPPHTHSVQPRSPLLRPHAPHAPPLSPVLAHRTDALQQKRTTARALVVRVGGCRAGRTRAHVARCRPSGYRIAVQAFGVDHPRARASAMRLLQVYDAQQGGREEEAAELRADPQVLLTARSGSHLSGPRLQCWLWVAGAGHSARPGVDEEMTELSSSYIRL